MEKVNLDHINIEKLESSINELRDILNQICCTIENDDHNEERLQISERLDELIVEYMRKIQKSE